MLTYRNSVPLLLSNVQTLLLMFHFVPLLAMRCSHVFYFTIGVIQTAGLTCKVYSYR